MTLEVVLSHTKWRFPLATVAKAVVELLVRSGVTSAYMVPGESYLALVDEWSRDTSTRLVSARHEGGAAFMAEAEAKLTGTPALALASRGPGATNLSSGVHTAMQDQTPMLVILGQVESWALGREGFQEVDLAAFYRPLAKWSSEARTSADVVPLVAEALTQARSGRPGPAVLSVPADFWEQPYDGVVPTVATPESRRLDQSVSLELVNRMRSARRPVIVAGPRAQVDPDRLRKVAEHYHAGVYVAFRRQDAFDEDHPLFLGHLRGRLPKEVLQGLDQADLVVVLGTRLDAVTSQDFAYPRPGQQVVMVGPGLPAPSGSDSTLLLAADVNLLLDDLIELGGRCDPGSRDWQAHHAEWVEYTRRPATTEADGVHPAAVIACLRELVPDDVTVTVDAGNFSIFFHRYWRFSSSQRLLAPANGSMGYAVPSAVAAKLAQPSKSVVAMVGDGGLLMTGQEVETAVRYGAPIVVIAYQNGMYGTIAMHQARDHGRLAGVQIGSLDLAGWARSLGARGLVLDDPADMETVLRDALASKSPCVVDVRTNPDIIAPGFRLSQMLEEPRP